MASALKEISTLPALRSAWSYIDSRAHGHRRISSGIDGESINDFATHTERNLLDVSRSLRSASSYEFGGLKAHLIPKASGGVRVICVPTVRDRIVQRAILDYLSEDDRCGVINTVSYGFVRNQTVEKAVRHAKNLRKRRPIAYKTDITKFFDRLDRNVLTGRIRERVRQTSLHDLLIRAANCDIYETRVERRKKITAAGIRDGKGVRQGMPMSPFFANLFLSDFDREAEAHKYRMIRYADDFIVFNKTSEACEAVDNFCRFQLGLLNLSIPEIGPDSKTRIYGPDESAEFLGVGIVKNGPSYSIRVLPNQFAEIKKRFLTYSDLDRLISEGTTLSSLAKRLEGSIAGYMGAYSFCDNIADLGDALSQWRTRVLEKLFSRLGIELTQLSAEQRTFLLS